jgi:hypothetical protein
MLFILLHHLASTGGIPFMRFERFERARRYFLPILLWSDPCRIARGVASLLNDREAAEVVEPNEAVKFDETSEIGNDRAGLSLMQKSTKQSDYKTQRRITNS